MGLNKIDALVKEVKETKKMDISKWGVFNLIDVFPEYSHGQRLTKADRVLGNLPLITAGQFNNGIAQYVKGNGRNKIFEDCVTIDMFGNCFYQEGKFVCDDNVYPIKNVKNKFVGLFLASIFSKSINFDFKKQFRLKHLMKVKIKLPINKDSEPDWSYMSNYIKILYYQKPNLDKLEQLPNIIIKKTKIDTSKWKKFKLTDLFNYQMRGKRQKSADRIHGKIPYYSASNKNNGLTDYISNPSFIEKNAIIISTFMDAYWVDGEFTASDEITIFKGNKLNKYNALFITSIIRKKQEDYNFTKKAFSNKLKNEVVLLPQDPFGQPDWELMENYMKDIYKKMEMTLK